MTKGEKYARARLHTVERINDDRWRLHEARHARNEHDAEKLSTQLQETQAALFATQQQLDRAIHDLEKTIDAQIDKMRS